MTIRLHRGDLPDLSRYQGGAVAIDTETMGLDPHRDRLCVVQLSPGDGSADVVQIPPGATAAPNLDQAPGRPATSSRSFISPASISASLYQAFGVMPAPVYCTKIASRLARTYTDKHGLKDLVRDVLGVDLSKQQQLSDWGADALTDAQVAYAASDVLHLHALKEQARRHAGARGARGAGGGLLPLPARPGPARSGRLGRRGHFRPFVEHDPETHRFRRRSCSNKPPLPRPGHICRATIARGNR